MMRRIDNSYDDNRQYALGMCATVMVHGLNLAHLARRKGLGIEPWTLCGDEWTRKPWFRKYSEGKDCSACMEAAYEIWYPIEERYRDSEFKAM